MATEYFLLHTHKSGAEGFLRGYPIHTDGRTLKEAKRAKDWQAVGGFDGDTMICVATDLPGIMTPKDEPKTPVLLMQGCLTNVAYRAMVTRIWGAGE